MSSMHVIGGPEWEEENSGIELIFKTFLEIKETWTLLYWKGSPDTWGNCRETINLEIYSGILDFEDKNKDRILRASRNKDQIIYRDTNNKYSDSTAFLERNVFK